MVAAVLAALCAALFAVSAAPAQEREPPRFRPDRVLVAFHEDAPPAARVGALGLAGLPTNPAAVAAGPVVVKLSPRARAAGADVTATLAALRRNPAVRVAEPDFVVTTAAVPDDSEFPSQYNLQNTGQTGGLRGADVDAVQAWDINTGRTSVVVAVIDSGVDYNHEDLRDNILRTPSGDLVGYDFVNRDPDPMDDNGHGTHVAGIIGARGNNRIGVAGVCWNVRMMPLKITDASGEGYISDAILAIDFAVTSGAKIINASFGGPGQSQLLLEAVQRARDAGVLFVAAAGNLAQNSDYIPQYPAGYSRQSQNVLAVGASDARDRLASFSNYGRTSVDLAAPGDQILSTTPGNTYSFHSGTSMATPHVTGAAALLLAHDPGLTVEKLKTRLLENTDLTASLVGKVRTGGRLNVWKALQGGEEPAGSQLSFFLHPNSVVGGTPVTGSVTINGAAPSGGFTVSLSSARLSLAAPPQTVIIPAGKSSAAFQIATRPTVQSLLVNLTARLNSVTGTGGLVVLAPTPSGVVVEPRLLSMGETARGRVTLTGPAPAGGMALALSASPRHVSMPSWVRVSPGETSAEFAVTGGSPKQPSGVTLTASIKGFKAATTVTVLPRMLRSLKVSPKRIRSGGASRGTVTLRHPAPSGGLAVTLQCTSPAAVVPPLVTVPAGQRSARFKIRAGKVPSAVTARVIACRGEEKQGVTLRLRR